MEILQYISSNEFETPNCIVGVTREGGRRGWLDELRRRQHTILVMRSLLSPKALTFGEWRQTINGQTRHLGEHGIIRGGGSFTNQAEWGLLSEFFNYIVTDDKETDKLIDVLEYCTLLGEKEDYFAASQTKYGRYVAMCQKGKVERYRPTARGGSLKEYMDKFRENTNLCFYVTGQFLFEARSFCGGSLEELGVSEEDLKQLTAWKSKYVKDYKTLRVIPCGKIRPMTSAEVKDDKWGADQTTFPAKRIISSLRLASACHHQGMEEPITIEPTTGSYVAPTIKRDADGVRLASLPKCYLYALGYQVDGNNEVTLTTQKDVYAVTCSYGEKLRTDCFGQEVISGRIEFDDSKVLTNNVSVAYQLMPSDSPQLKNADFV